MSTLPSRALAGGRVTAVTPHWHAFAYTGPRYPYDRVPEDGGAPEGYPAEDNRDLLDLPAERFEARFETPVAAFGWLRRELFANPPGDDLAARAIHADTMRYGRYYLVDEPERDVGARYHSRAGLWVVRVLLACGQRSLTPWEAPVVCPEDGT